MTTPFARERRAADNCAKWMVRLSFVVLLGLFVYALIADGV